MDGVHGEHRAGELHHGVPRPAGILDPGSLLSVCNSPGRVCYFKC
jgi:hypothetical protein